MTDASTPLPAFRSPQLLRLQPWPLADCFGELGVPRYRADQVFSWVYQKRMRDALDMMNLPAALCSQLTSLCDLALPGTPKVFASSDGMTHKFVLHLQDGARVEAVSMRTEKRLTLCVSSQVGCALKCSSAPPGSWASSATRAPRRSWRR